MRLKDRKGYVRSADVAERMQVSKPSVTNAVSVLRESGGVLRRAGVPEGLARRDAGALEHGLSTESAAYLKKFA